MLDKIIQKLKDLIPKKKGDETKKPEGIPPSGTPAASSSPAQPLTPDEAKKKKKALIIKIVAGVVVLYMVADEFLFKEQPAPEPQKTEVAHKKKGDRKPKKALKELEKPAVSREVSSVPTEQPKPVAPESQPKVETPPAPAQAPTEMGLEAPSTPTPAEVTSETPPPPAPVETAVEKPQEPQMAAEAPTEKPQEPQMAVETPTEKPAVEEAPKGGPPMEQITQDMESVSKEVGPIPEEEIKPAEEVALPDYTIKGRGLVYNCSGKHWACIDKAGYLACREHMNWSKDKSKKPECVVKNVYTSEEDCAVIQLHYINTNEPAEFCK